MIKPFLPDDDLWERIDRAVDKIQKRLEKATALLQQNQVPYVVIGGHAVAAWVGRIDETAVRQTKDVDLLLRRENLPEAIQALEQEGFHFVNSFDVPMFLDDPAGIPRNAVHLIFAGEKVKPNDLIPAPLIEESEIFRNRSVLNLDALVRMKLTSFCLKDKVHLIDMIQVGLVDATWLNRVPEVLRDRLQEMLDSPDLEFHG